MVDRNLEFARRDRTGIRNRRQLRCHRLDPIGRRRRIRRTSNLVVICVFARESRRILDVLCRHCTCGIGYICVLRTARIQINRRRGVDIGIARGLIRDHPRKLQDIIANDDIAIVIRMCCTAVVDLSNPFRHSCDLTRCNSSRRRHMPWIRCIHLFEISRGGIICAECIVREWIVRRICRTRHHVICDVLRLRYVRGSLLARRITCKMPGCISLQYKADLARIA